MHQREQQQQQRSQRKQSQTPDMVKQSKPEDGKEPKGNRPEPQDQGRNETAEMVRDDGTEKVQHARDKERWGSLPDYLEMLKTRGSQPDVPERYRKYREAFLKQSQKNNDGNK